MALGVTLATEDNLPDDPSVVASPIDPTLPSDIARDTAFLYTGPNPIQTGVIDGTIEPRRAAVLRGLVINASGTPLSGVSITVLDHPEFGSTKTRADGMFDLAVNGGGALTLVYSRSGFLPVQRTIDAPWRDYAWLPDVVLTALDTASTTITLDGSSDPLMVRGSAETDADGSRRSTLLFPAGTTATMVLPNGNVQDLTTLTVRSTEYTVGDSGPDAMPGELPAYSGYTYAVELSVDEAIAAGATKVQFDRPIWHYVENFIGFPVGSIAPIGYYDREAAAWVAAENGRVVAIVSKDANNRANLEFITAMILRKGCLSAAMEHKYLHKAPLSSAL